MQSELPRHQLHTLQNPVQCNAAQWPLGISFRVAHFGSSGGKSYYLICHISHETAIFRKAPTHIISGDRKKLVRSSIDRHLNTLCFCENIRTRNNQCTQHFDRTCVCNSSVQYCGNLSLTNFVGCGKLPFHEPYIYNKVQQCETIKFRFPTPQRGVSVSKL